ncbi:MAG TPA: phosphate ABC transporter permease PstA [Candidatus Eubacterium faecavium]|nr:phosphate ABC transporter permease PstA [Candidatus Eubacterium faecavium]
MKDGINKMSFRQKLMMYKKRPKSLLLAIVVMISAVVCAAVVLFIIGYILVKGIPNLSPRLFEWTYNSENVSMMPAIINTLIYTAASLLIAVPAGVFAAIYLAEYARRGNRFVRLIRITAETLSGIPSIVYGLFGYLMFCVYFKLGYSMIAGTLTLAIMILPLIMRTTEEALRAVPDSYREASYGLGAGKLRTVFRVILPSAMPGILSGIILGTGRIVGETAALIYTAGTVAGVVTKLTDSGRTLSVHMYALLSEGLYMEEAYATAVILLLAVIIINAVSGFIASKISEKGGGAE